MLAPFTQEVFLYAFGITATVLEYLLIAVSVGYIDRIHCLQCSYKNSYTRQHYSSDGVFLESPIFNILNFYKVLAHHIKKKIKLFLTCEMLSI